MKETLKKILFGITLPQEYLCISLEDFSDPLRVFTINRKNELEEVTEEMLLIGYKPLLFGYYKTKESKIEFTAGQPSSFLFKTDKNEILASLKMKLVREQKLGTDIFCMLEGIHGSQKFVNTFQKIMNDLWYKITAEKKINVYLKGNLYDQIKIAYSVPRIIYLASLGSEGLFNIFPTDLSGKAGDDYFIVSLRTDRKANQQLEKTEKCLIAPMHSDSFMEVYLCGRNHSKDLTEAASLGIGLRTERSEKLNLPVPKDALNYYELELLDKVEIGVHSIHFCKIISTVALQKSNAAAAHIHRYYAEWRQKKNITTDYLIRTQVKKTSF